MTNPAETVEALVAKLRAIPELVAEMEGDAARIYAYHDAHPRNVSLLSAVYEAPHPSIVVAWQRTSPGQFGRNEVWKHDLILYLRAREAPEAPDSSYCRLFMLMVNGVPQAAHSFCESARRLRCGCSATRRRMKATSSERISRPR